MQLFGKKIQYFFRSLWFWINWALIPVGIFGSTTSLVDLFNGVFYWKGFVGYIYKFWAHNFAPRFHQLFENVAMLLEVNPPSGIFADYLTLGLLLYISGLRSYSYITFISPKRWNNFSVAPPIIIEKLNKRNEWRKYINWKALGEHMLVIMMMIVELPITIFAWPLVMLYCLYRLIHALSSRKTLREEIEQAAVSSIVALDYYARKSKTNNQIIISYSLVLLPFGLFILLILLNYLFVP